MEPEEDERREAAIASSQSLRPDYKPEKPTSITQTQLSKFQNNLSQWGKTAQIVRTTKEKVW
ncbi:hypothetical protein Leryth_006693 [Lithospermum erythrorhizon]|nr:hypothetical protein Leryth_006693 [Lithospermum erythrorhizon]